MISKLIVHGKTREDAIHKMVRAIDEYKITGVKNTLKFCKFVIEHEQFKSGKFDTHFVQQYYEPSLLSVEKEDEMLVAAMVSTLLLKNVKTHAPNTETSGELSQKSNWKKNRSNLR
jgi:acetyl/propionyl-CoA carboxylase alpha subunit